MRRVDPEELRPVDPADTTLTLKAALPALEVAMTVVAPILAKALKLTLALPVEDVVTTLELEAELESVPPSVV